MGVYSININVTTSASPIVIPETDITTGHTVWLHNHEHQSKYQIFIGGPSVSASTGMHIAETQTIGPITLSRGEQLYAIGTQASATLQVFATGV